MEQVEIVLMPWKENKYTKAGEEISHNTNDHTAGKQGIFLDNSDVSGEHLNIKTIYSLNF